MHCLLLELASMPAAAQETQRSLGSLRVRFPFPSHPHPGFHFSSVLRPPCTFYPIAYYCRQQLYGEKPDLLSGFTWDTHSWTPFIWNFTRPFKRFTHNPYSSCNWQWATFPAAPAARIALGVSCPQHIYTRYSSLQSHNGCSFNRKEQGRAGLYEPLLQENEREAITALLQYLESRFLLSLYLSIGGTM